MFSEFRVNDPGFEEARAAARASDRVMYRETDAGLRYFVKQGETRVVSSQATVSAKAMAMGVTIDPSYAFPLPMLGTTLSTALIRIGACCRWLRRSAAERSTL